MSSPPLHGDICLTIAAVLIPMLIVQEEEDTTASFTCWRKPDSLPYKAKQNQGKGSRTHMSSDILLEKDTCLAWNTILYPYLAHDSLNLCDLWLVSHPSIPIKHAEQQFERSPCVIQKSVLGGLYAIIRGTVQSWIHKTSMFGRRVCQTPFYYDVEKDICFAWNEIYSSGSTLAGPMSLMACLTSLHPGLASRATIQGREASVLSRGAFWGTVCYNKWHSAIMTHTSSVFGSRVCQTPFYYDVELICTYFSPKMCAWVTPVASYYIIPHSFNSIIHTS